MNVVEEKNGTMRFLWQFENCGTVCSPW